MEVPPSSHAVWKVLIMGKKTHTFEFLGLQLLLKRLTLKVTLNPAAENVNKSINELRNMFIENIKLPKVQRDLEKIFGNMGDVS